VGRLPASQRGKARIIGLGLALVARVLMLFILLSLSSLTTPLYLDFTVRDLILVAGGLFLLWKAVTEIHHTIELRDDVEETAQPSKTFFSVISGIVLLDIVFSVDSVITAIGLTDKIWIIITAVIVSFVLILAFARPIGDFILKHPALKILALSFLYGSVNIMGGERPLGRVFPDRQTWP
jgi:predicted tellurium resistance membrane protein TerC